MITEIGKVVISADVFLHIVALVFFIVTGGIYYFNYKTLKEFFSKYNNDMFAPYNVLMVLLIIDIIPILCSFAFICIKSISLIYHLIF